MLEKTQTADMKGVVELKPFMEAVFYIKDEQSLDEFWSFMMKEEGLTKTIEFIIHICSETLYESSEEIRIEFKFFKYISYFQISNPLFSRKAMQHYLKIRAFLSVEIDDESVILKSLRDNDKMSCRFCKILKDDDPKIATNNIFQDAPCEMPEGISNMQRCPVNLHDEFGNDELSFLMDELGELESEIFDKLKILNDKSDMSLLHPVSLKIFVYSQKLLASVEFYELSISMRSLSFLIQKLFNSDYATAKKPLILCECMLGDISEWRKSTLGCNEKVNAHYLDASLASSLSQMEELIGKIK